MNKEQKIELKQIDSFTLQDIFECGQCFRWNRQENGSYIGVVKNNVIQVEQKGDSVFFTGIGEDSLKELCTSYFNMKTDYKNIKQKLSRYRFIFKRIYYIWSRYSHFKSRLMGNYNFIYNIC